MERDGQASLRALESLPQTLCSLTGRKGPDGERKGAHLYFILPPAANIRNSAGRLGKGLDIRGEGGYVVAPPSLHASGLRYEWDFDQSTIADLPSWLIAKTSKPAIAIIPTAVRWYSRGPTQQHTRLQRWGYAQARYVPPRHSSRLV